MQQPDQTLLDQLLTDYGSVSSLPEDWKHLTRIALKAVKHSNGVLERAVLQSEQLLDEFLAHGCFRNPLLKEAIGWEEIVGILFYNKLYLRCYGNGQRPHSPVAQKKDPSWMAHADFCFVNVRATGNAEHETGNFIDATRLLPLLRARAIHLAPFFENVFGIVYAQDSFTIVSDQVTNSLYESQGFSRYKQLQYFIDCCHLLGKAVGFDLTSHTSGFSRLSFDRPELFRWVRFSDDYEHLYNDQSIDEQYQESCQAAFVAHIRALTRSVYQEYDLDCLEDAEQPLVKLRAAFRHAKRVVRSFGYYTVVPHTWNGVGLPGIKEYNKAGHYPIWDYRDIHGADQSAHGMGIHASLKFHTNLAANRTPYPDDPGWSAESWEPTVAYLSELFPRMHQSYGFDFLRIDYVDHIFKSTIAENGKEVVLCEQPSPSQLKRIADTARSCFPACGMLADHVGTDIDRYSQVGFTLILGKEVLCPLHRDTVRELLVFNQQLQQHSAAERPCGSIVFPIDTHDAGHPAFLGRDLPEREGRALVQLRHLFARFSSAGPGHRPKYETIGNQDLSCGIYRANNRAESLRWGHDRAHLCSYHAIEDVYEQCRDDILGGVLAAADVFDDHCWWRIDNPSNDVSLLVLTWIGDHYDHNRAGEYSVQTTISLPNPPGREVHVEPLLGIRPGTHAEDSAGVHIAHRQLRYHTQDHQIHFSWPHLSSWIVRVRYR